MKDKQFNNADSFAMSFDEEWKKIDCEDLRLKIDQIFAILSDHPFGFPVQKMQERWLKFRIFSLKKFK